VLGWQAPKARRVMIIDGEMAEDDLINRAKMLAPAIEGLEIDKAAGNINVLSRQRQNYRVSFPDLASKEGQSVVMRSVKRFGADIVVLDNFSTLTAIADENSAAAMNPVLDFLLQLKQEHIACILVHHANKAGTGARGSSKLEATFEVIIGLQKLKDALADPGKGAMFGIEWTKFRGLRDDSICDRKAWLSTDATTGKSEWHAEFSQNEQAAALVALVQSCKYATQAALADAFPRHLRPDPNKVPSAGWISNLKDSAIFGLELITEDRWNACMQRARQLASGGEEAPERSADGAANGEDMLDALSRDAGEEVEGEH
jgi:KaiC/GvpD/RAD55 family RecA-like ATPase